MREIIKNVRLPQIIKLQKNVDEYLEYIVENYNFTTFDLSHSNITYKGLKFLNNYYCHSVNLSCCKLVTYEGIKALSNCYAVNLYWCNG